MLPHNGRSRGRASGSSSSVSTFGFLSIILNLAFFAYLCYHYTRPCSHVKEPPIFIKPDRIGKDFHIKSIPASEQGSVLASANGTPSLGRIWTPPPPSAELILKDDLINNPNFDLNGHVFTWHYCDIKADELFKQPIPFCDQTPNSEQKYQMSWFGTHVVPGLFRAVPNYLKCVNLPPPSFQWPRKDPPLPATEPAVHWPNFRVASHKDLVIFNRATPKNLYHFDAPSYDLDALGEMEIGTKYIPFGPKIRLMLDVGAGGGSLGLLIKRKYDIQVLATVFADWPYCEYITERGGLCMLVDVMEAMPYAKFSWDVLHVSWVYHGQQVAELITMYNELNRILRPGGYLWMRGGWSNAQVAAIKHLLIDQFGYTSLYEKITNKPKDITAKVNFGPNLPYEVDWNVIFLKPIRAQSKKDCSTNLFH